MWVITIRVFIFAIIFIIKLKKNTSFSLINPECTYGTSVMFHCNSHFMMNRLINKVALDIASLYCIPRFKYLFHELLCQVTTRN